jgi:hypothetical protein
VDQFYFDDDTWAVRYLIVDTGGWLAGRQVLISPISVVKADWAAERIEVALTKSQVENSPSIETHKPVSRRYEAIYFTYYGYPYYWGGPLLWGPAPYPARLAAARQEAAEAAIWEQEDPGDVHLRSTNEVAGYHIQATDGEIGHIEDFIVSTMRAGLSATS